jgi:hypothetical protein
MGDDIYITTFDVSNWSECYRYSIESWESRGAIDPSILFCAVFSVGEDTIFFAPGTSTDLVWISYNFCETWQETFYQSPYPGQTFGFYDVVYDPFMNRVWTSTGAGLCYMTIDEITPVEQIHTATTIPIESFTITPNPFNPTATVAFQVTKAGNVSLVIYDVHGRKIKSLVDGHHYPGSYVSILDASALTTGVYFAALETGPYSEVKKFLVLK